MARVPRIVWVAAALALLVAPGAMVKGCGSAAPPPGQAGAPHLVAVGNGNNLYVALAEGAGDEARFTYWQRDAAGLWHEPGSGTEGLAAATAWREHLLVFFPTGRYGLFGLGPPRIRPAPALAFKPAAAAEDGLVVDAFGWIGDEPVHARPEAADAIGGADPEAAEARPGPGAWKIQKIDIPIKAEAVRDPCAARFKGRLFLVWREEVPAIAARGSTWRLHFAYLDEKGWKGPYPAQGSPGLAMDSPPGIAATADSLLCLFKAPPADGKPAAWALAAYDTGDENWHEINRLEGVSLQDPLALARWRDRFCVAAVSDGRPRVALLEGQPLRPGPVEPVWPGEQAETPPGVGLAGGLLMAAFIALLLLVSRWRGRTVRQAAEGQLAASGAEPHPLGRRILAAAIDHAVLLGVTVVFVGCFYPSALARWQQNLILGRESVALQLGYIAGVLVYFSVAEALTGKTLGKALLGLEVRSETGGRITVGQAVLRNVLRLIDGIPGLLYLVGLVAVLMGPMPQRLGDRLARTLVVRTGAQKPGGD